MLGIVVGLAAEARIAAGCGYPIRIGGGTPGGAEVAATQLIADGASALLSFGLAGGLDPALRPGTTIVPSHVLSDGEKFETDRQLADRFGGLTGHVVLAGSAIVANAAQKHRLQATTQAQAVDLESGAVARVARAYGLPFLVVRAICDSAERTLPPAALLALKSGGKIGMLPVIRSVLRHPHQIFSLLALARDASRARRALMRFVQCHCRVRQG